MMMRPIYLLLTTLVFHAFAETETKNQAENTDSQDIAKVTETVTSDTTNSDTEVDPAMTQKEVLKKMQEAVQALKSQNSIKSEQFKASLRDQEETIAKLKLERTLLEEKLKLEQLQIQAEHQKEIQLLKNEKELNDIKLAKSQAETTIALNEAKIEDVTSQSDFKAIQAELATLKMEQKQQYFAKTKATYLDDPLLENGTLVISDRRIPLNGVISYETANFITERIAFFNNLDSNKPIFIVIDASPGGSVMAGFRILKAMEGSKAPVYTVVKSFAASMAAGITTLADKSYAYPNAIILHHQILTFTYGNLTDQRESLETLEEWWRRLATPIAKKMGITLDNFIERMYAETKSGDWDEFADEAQKLKWVDYIVDHIEETSVLVHPDHQNELAIAINPGQPTPQRRQYQSVLGSYPDRGPRELPQLFPYDCFYLHNPDNYYKAQ